MATNPLTLLNGTTADANDVEAKINPLYTSLDPSNVSAGSKTGTGNFVLSTSPTITTPVFSGSITGTYTLGGTPTIASPILSGSVTGTYTLGGTPTITNPTINSASLSGTITYLNTTEAGSSLVPLILSWRSPSPATNDVLSLHFKQNSDTTNDAITCKISQIIEDVTHATRNGGLSFATMNNGTEDGVFRIGGSGNLGMKSGQKFFNDGVDQTGDTYSIESSANVYDRYVGGNLAVRFVADGMKFHEITTLNHGMTDYGLTSMYGWINRHTATGGINILGLMSAATLPAVTIHGINTGGSSTVPTNDIVGGKKSGTGSTNLADTDLHTTFSKNDGTQIIKVLGDGQTLFPDVDPPTANCANRNSFFKASFGMTAAGGRYDDYNISSLSYLAGIYTVTFDTDFANTNFQAVIMATGTNDTGVYSSKAVGSLVYTIGGADVDHVFQAWGDQ